MCPELCEDDWSQIYVFIANWVYNIYACYFNVNLATVAM